MATDCYTQLGFGFQPKLVVDFAGGTLTTDAGLLLVREFDQQLGLSADAIARLTDTRDARYVTHDLDTLVRQRLYQFAAGYEDVNDADRLRHDPTLQVVAADGRTTLSSQPTLSRWENAIDWPAIQRLARTGVDWFCAYAYGPDEHPADLILDLDSTDDPTHGTQQLALFHGWYDQHMYHPLVWFEGRTGLLLRTRLRPGRDASATGVVDELRHILPPLRRRFPHTPIFLRGDAGMRHQPSKPSSNAFRLQLHSLALLLLAYFRRAVLAGTRLASATIGTIRLHLLKVAGRVVRSVRRLWFHLASSWPGQPLFTSGHRALARAPA